MKLLNPERTAEGPADSLATLQNIQLMIRVIIATRKKAELKAIELFI
jgi:hypothetical protein